jgi:hypothetical protein
MGLTEGWLETLLQARPDYFVWGNILLLALSVENNIFFYGLELTHLPKFVALISYSLLSCVAAASYVVLSKELSAESRVVLYGLILLMPVGASGNEIFGRIVNLGFLFIFLCVLLVVLRERYAGDKRKALTTALIDVFLLVCANTNPFCYPLLFSYLGFRIWRVLWTVAEKRALREDLRLVLLLIIFAVWIAWRHGGFTPGAEVLRDEPLNWTSIIELVTARSILFFLLFPWYHYLNDALAIALFVPWLFLLSWSFTGADRRSTAIIISLGALLLVLFATVATRPGLTVFISGYRGTFPDRYFYAQNLLALLTTLLAIETVSRSGRRFLTLTCRFALGAILLIYAAALPSLFEYDRPKLAIDTGSTLSQQVVAAVRDVFKEVNVGKTVRVAISPEGWNMSLPLQYAIVTALRSAPIEIVRTGVAADFDGDHKSDMALYQTDSGRWVFAGSASGGGVHSTIGGRKFLPVPGRL